MSVRVFLSLRLERSITNPPQAQPTPHAGLAERWPVWFRRSPLVSSFTTRFRLGFHGHVSSVLPWHAPLVLLLRPRGLFPAASRRNYPGLLPRKGALSLASFRKSL